MAGDVSKRKEAPTMKLNKFQMEAMMSEIMRRMKNYERNMLMISLIMFLRFRRKLGPKGVARMYPVLLDVLRETHSLTYSVPPQRERSRPGRLLDTLIRRSRGQSKQSTEETKPVHSRDDHELLRGALKRMSSPQNITDMCNQIFKDLEKDKRQSTRPSSKATDPRNCSKQEQIIQELKREPSNKHCLHF
ncbi:uncharacterized protein LOC106394425 isoform X3 [Brassica napus]|uniref:uncharacterized protein LOC106394425 isoform X3 n=1 Tax=Brassica napus TaxID=3708 RepID=UPI0006AADB6A|nr:uncharacterized protein LOC106394425 isoform X3 [Brassica napus]